MYIIIPKNPRNPIGTSKQTIIVATTLARNFTSDDIYKSDYDRYKNPSRSTKILDVAIIFPYTNARFVNVIDAVLPLTI